MAGLAKVFGSGAMTNSIMEIENNDLLFVIGSNTTEAHPIIGLWMKKAVRKGAKLIVADPRKINLVKFSHLWLRQKPGTDVALLNGIAHVILKEGLEDKDFIHKWTEGFEEWKRSVEEYSPERVEGITGVPKDDIIKAARLYGTAEKAGIYYTMGITQHSHGTDNVFSIANLALLTGNLGKESAGVNPLRGQNNVQGSTDMGCISDSYPGYQKVMIPSVREKFEEEWGASLSDRPGLSVVEMTEAALEGRLKALYVMGENPVLSDPHMAHTVESLKSLELLVVQDIFLTETTELAHVVLPAASFAEKNGTFTNTERRVQRVRKAVNPPGDAREDLRIISAISERIGYTMGYDHPEEIFREIGRIWPALAGMDYRRLEPNGLQWPCPTKDHPGTPYLFRGGFPRGNGIFTSVEYKPSGETPDKEYPFLLTTGRILFRYHTGTMSARSKALQSVAPEAHVEINNEDAVKLGIKEGQKVKVKSRRGTISLKAKVTERSPKGVLFIPIHFNHASANTLTNDLLDPHSKTPEFKVCAVRIEV